MHQSSCHRTGYLICRYLIQKCGVEPKEAVSIGSKKAKIISIAYLQNMPISKKLLLILDKSNSLVKLLKALLILFILKFLLCMGTLNNTVLLFEQFLLR